MLDELLCQHQRADGQVLHRSGDACVQNQVRRVARQQQLRRHGDIDLANAAGAGDDPRRDGVKRHARDCLQFLGAAALQQALQLRLHGVDQADLSHAVTLLPAGPDSPS